MNTVSVIGQGYVGLPLAIEIASSSFRCFGIDNSNLVVDKINSGELQNKDINGKKIRKLAKKGLYKCTSDRKFLRNSDVIIFCLPTPLTSNKSIDLSILIGEIKLVKSQIKSSALVIIESTVDTGFTRKLQKYLPENDLAFSPERIDPLNQKWDVKNTPKLVAGLTDKARDRAVEFYSKFIDTVIPCSSLEVAETAKLLENSFRLINISFINELAIFCNKIGIDVQEVIKAASTKPYGFMPFYPSVGIGGHCIPVDPVYLSHKAKEVGAPTSFKIGRAHV